MWEVQTRTRSEGSPRFALARVPEFPISGPARQQLVRLKQFAEKFIPLANPGCGRAKAHRFSTLCDPTRVVH
jgi:hypothetical protein